MQIVGWSLDLAREQSLDAASLNSLLQDSHAAGFNLLGLYLEHRFLYPSAPWAAAAGALTPADARQVCGTARQLGIRLVPMLNTLGHMEGFIRCEGGQWLAESELPGALGQQICPTRAECRALAARLVDDALASFDSDWIHLGGDETRQLGHCPQCAERARSVGLGGLYGEYYAGLCRRVLDAGRRPCLWGDMLLAHPDAAEHLPRETVIFDWHYDGPAGASTRQLMQQGFEVVCCPALHTFDSAWCFWPASQENIDQHAADARACGALGVCVTTWEFCFFSEFASVRPLVMAAGARLSGGSDWDRALLALTSAAEREAIDILGRQIPAASAFLAWPTWRQLRDRLAIRLNPFWLWRDWRAEACGRAGDEVLDLASRVTQGLEADAPLAFPALLHEVAVRWVRAVQAAHGAYQERKVTATVAALERGRAELLRLREPLAAIAALGGSSGDPGRLERLVERADAAIRRVRAVSLTAACRPAFETLVHDHYISGDQAGWRTSVH